MKTAADLPLRVVSASATEADVAISLDPDFAGFQGHFPGAPVLPGMCHVDLAVRAASKAFGRAFTLAAVERARFAARVLPGADLRCRLTLAGDALDVRHLVDERLVAELRLEVRVAPASSPAA